jgi:hypothetical protein
LNAKFQKDGINPIRVKKVPLELTLAEFLLCFKRFSVVMLDDALDIVGPEYEATVEE